MKSKLRSTFAAALLALACLAGAAKADGTYSSRTGGQLIGMSTMSGDVAGAYMDGSSRAAAASLDTGAPSDLSAACDRYFGDQYAACTDGYNGYGCVNWDGDNWWACQYGQTAAQQDQAADSPSTVSSGGGGGGAVDPFSGLLFAAFAGVGAAAKRRKR